MKILPILLLFALAFLFPACSKAPTPSSPPPVDKSAEREKVFNEFQEFADKSYPGWKVAAIRKDETELDDEALEKTYYYLNLTKDGADKTIFVMMAAFELPDGRLEAKIFEPTKV